MNFKILTALIFVGIAMVFTACPRRVEKEKVVVEMYVMSKCPFTAQALNGIAPVLKKMGDNIDFKLDFIGNESEPGKFTSMRGEAEVRGNKIQLCAMAYEPVKFLDLLGCMNKNIQNIPANFEECGKEAGVNVERIKNCVDGDKGKTLLSESIKRADARDAKGSPTIFIGGEPHRGGRSERDFTGAICKFYQKSPPSLCADIPQPKDIKVTMITDKRCPECNTDRLSQNLKGVFPGLEAEVFDYSDPKGKELYDQLAAKGHDLLPMVIFNKDVEQDEGFQRISRFVVSVDDHRLLRVGAKFNPTREICDNGIDDTGNGLIDCEDPDCKDELVCREEEKKRLDIFVMSLCPFTTRAFNSMKEVLDAFKDDGLKFNINYIANEVEPGKFTSLGRDLEVKENKRQLCAMKHYPRNFMDYIWCRGENIRGTDWKPCAKGPIKAAVIEKCSEGDEGIKLLSENIKAANSMGIGASPTWVINNKHKASGVEAEDIKNHICRYNPGLKGCSKTLSKGAPGRNPSPDCGG